MKNCLFFIRGMENGNGHNREQKRKSKRVCPQPSLNSVKSVEHLMSGALSAKQRLFNE